MASLSYENVGSESCLRQFVGVSEDSPGCAVVSPVGFQKLEEVPLFPDVRFLKPTLALHIDVSFIDFPAGRLTINFPRSPWLHRFARSASLVHTHVVTCAVAF